jgi:hypothetical protein
MGQRCSRSRAVLNRRYRRNRRWPSRSLFPVFIFRHYVQDKGVFPANMLADLSPDGKPLRPPKAGMLPYITLAAGVVVAAAGYLIFWT